MRNKINVTTKFKFYSFYSLPLPVPSPHLHLPSAFPCDFHLKKKKP